LLNVPVKFEAESKLQYWDGDLDMWNMTMLG